MKKLKTTAAQMVAAARKRVTEIETPDLIAKVDDPNVVIVDIRDIRERQRSGFIPGSIHAPRGTHFPGVRLRPLGHLSVTRRLTRAFAPCKAQHQSDAHIH